MISKLTCSEEEGVVGVGRGGLVSPFGGGGGFRSASPLLEEVLSLSHPRGELARMYPLFCWF